MVWKRNIIMLPKILLDALACPKCKGSLIFEKQRNRLVCNKCKLAFRIEEDTPIMLLEEAEKIA
jgi:uncharacterized protein YbaR (Trm112 family)